MVIPTTESFRGSREEGLLLLAEMLFLEDNPFFHMMCYTLPVRNLTTLSPVSLLLCSCLPQICTSLLDSYLHVYCPLGRNTIWCTFPSHGMDLSGYLPTAPYLLPNL